MRLQVSKTARRSYNQIARSQGFVVASVWLLPVRAGFTVSSGALDEVNMKIGDNITLSQRGIEHYPHLEGCRGKIEAMNPKEQPYVHVVWDDGQKGFCHKDTVEKV